MCVGAACICDVYSIACTEEKQQLAETNAGRRVTHSVLGYFVCALSACLDNNCNNYMHPACTDTTDRLALLARHRLGESVLLALRSVVCVVCCTPYSRGVCIVCCLHADMAAELEKLNKQLVAKNAVLNKENEDYSGVCYTLFL